MTQFNSTAITRQVDEDLFLALPETDKTTTFWHAGGNFLTEEEITQEVREGLLSHRYLEAMPRACLVIEPPAIDLDAMLAAHLANTDYPEHYRDHPAITDAMRDLEKLLNESINRKFPALPETAPMRMSEAMWERLTVEGQQKKWDWLDDSFPDSEDVYLNNIKIT